MVSPDHRKAEPALETTFGERFVLRDTAADTDGELLRIDTYLDPGVRRPLHSHPKQNERFVVHEGTLGVALEDSEVLLEPGDEKSVSAGTPHTFWNAGDDKVHMTTEHRPALRFEEFLQAMVELDREDGLDSDGMPANPLVGAVLLDEFHNEMRPADIPVSIQRILFPALATVGRKVGYGVPNYSKTDERQEQV
ncbi:cupin domain-containing protein [Haloterrigena alkaliphila]|uniref:cupin domain-containing protein n=1 Tax=Haloterrigena alkaliphila TaxID=2816475 RepID=UPI001D00193F|nr:cupin domain-containing protein [Haloterrigena alkaliphila]UHQ95075.1 cupin domain-containing protein [Haloterrigena alkaliphila]